MTNIINYIHILCLCESILPKLRLKSPYILDWVDARKPNKIPDCVEFCRRSIQPIFPGFLPVKCTEL